MSLKRITLLALISPLLLGGCKKEEDKEVFLSNYHYLETVLPKENDRVLTGTTKTIKELQKLSINFLVYFHKPDCYWCDNFEPILNNYLTTHETLVVDVPYDTISDFKKEFPDIVKFDSSFSFPYLGVMNNAKPCERISNDQYMQTTNAFTNYMENRIRKTHIYYADINEKFVKNTRKITNISLNTTDDSSINLYNQKVYSLVTQTPADVLITNRDEPGLFLQAIDENQTIKEKTQVTSETESSSIERFF